MHANSYFSSGFEVRNIAPKLNRAFPGRQTLALVRILAVASIGRQGNDLIGPPLRNLPERGLEKSRIIVSSNWEDNGPKNVDFEFPVSLPRYQVPKIIKAANPIVIPRAGAMRILQADKQLAQLREPVIEHSDVMFCK